MPDCSDSDDRVSAVGVVFAGGGTGGHLVPGIALAQEMRSRQLDSEILFLGTESEIESRLVPHYGFSLRQIKSAKLNRGVGMFRFLSLMPWSLTKSFWGFCQSFNAIRKMKPDVIVGLGGYGSVAPILSGSILGIPSMLLEQNVVPGRANRFLSRFATEVECQWEESIKYFRRMKGKDSHKFRLSGNPVRRDFLPACRRSLQRPTRAQACVTHPASQSSPIEAFDRTQWLKKLGLSPVKRTLLVMGGSQGSLPINRAILDTLPLLERRAGVLQLIHCAGAYSFEMVREGYEGARIKAYVCDFMDDMRAAYSVSDLVINRAGGTSIAEITALGVPAILVPLPHAADDHQRLNAQSLERNGAAIVLDQKDFSPERIVQLIDDLLGLKPGGEHEKDKLRDMRRNSLALGKPQAASFIVNRALEIATRSASSDAKLE